MKSKKQPKTIDEYIQTFPKDTAAKLKTIREVVKKLAPKALEAISYQMPAFKLNGKNLVYFAGWKNHIGFYALPSGTKAFKEELAAYKIAKGSIQFPLDKPLPLPLIRKIVKYRIKESFEKKEGVIKNWKTCSRGHRFERSSRYPVCPLCWPGHYKKKSS